MGKGGLCSIQFLFQILFIGIVVTVNHSHSINYDVFLEIVEAVPFTDCSEIITNLEITLTKTARHLYEALDGVALFHNFFIILPNSWPKSCVPLNRSIEMSRGDPSDITIMHEHRLFGDQIWTQQSGKCGERGNQIFATTESFKRSSAPKELVNEWIKYQFGVFDEIGYISDEIYPLCHTLDNEYVTGCSFERIKANEYCKNNQLKNISQLASSDHDAKVLFTSAGGASRKVCNEGSHDPLAPTKHNFLCDRKSVREVIMRIVDRSIRDSTRSTRRSKSLLIPKITYLKRTLTRYVVLIDETQNMLVRESWSFLRSAVRKWLVYDLQPNTEVGLVLVDETSVDKMLDITSLDLPKNRDLIASFIPYTPIDSPQSACVSCGIKHGLKLLSERRDTHGFSSEILLIIAAGLDFKVENKLLTEWAVENRTRIVTINFPSVLRNQPLDVLAHSTYGDAFTVLEKKYNGEKSYLNTYFDLTSILFYISSKYFEGPVSKLPVEIHRKELVDMLNDSNTSKKLSRSVSGNFYLDDGMTTPSGFFIYTHNIEIPLIQNVTLTSPGGITYGTRSDQRIPVKQITIVASVNQTGTWSYRIERFNGNPQPHFVQVLATPNSPYSASIQSRAWINRRDASGPFILYCEVKRGGYPVHSAYIEAQITRPTLKCNLTDNCVEKLKLLDTGSGDPDITKGDGIYSRYFSTTTGGPGMYRFDITVDDNGNTAYALPTGSDVKLRTENMGLTCCGSVISDMESKQIPPFQRRLPPITITVIEIEKEPELKVLFGRIGDLTGKYIGDGKISLSWTAPDLGGLVVTKYEIRYALSLLDIIHNFESIASIWAHASPYPYSIGGITNFIVDVNMEPHLFGSSLYLAVRPFSKIHVNIIPGPVSNPVRVFVLKPLKPTTPIGLKGNDTDIKDNTDTNYFDSENQSSTGVSPTVGNNIKEYTIAIAVGMFIICVTIVTYLIFCITQRHRRREKRNGLCSTNCSIATTEAIPCGDLAILETSSGDFQYLDKQKHVHNEKYANSKYQAIEPPDHHIVGLPMFLDQSDYQKIDFMGRMSPTLYSAYGTLSIISSNDNTQPKIGRMLSPYESWTASQLLCEHEVRDLPSKESEEKIDVANMNYNAPPIPPLPLTSHPFNLYSDATSELNERNQPPAYSTIRKNGSPHQSHTSPKSNKNNSSFSTPFWKQGSSLGTLNAVEKKIRNVTMV